MLNSINFWQSYSFMVCFAKLVRRDHVVQDELRGVAAFNCWLNLDLFEKKVSSIPPTKIVRRRHAVQDELGGVAVFNCWWNLD